jgi:signal transduction histidine kinase
MSADHRADTWASAQASSRRGSGGAPGAPETTLWFSAPAVAVLVLPLFARRRFPFAAPAAYWLMLGCIVIVVSNIPGAQSASDLVFIPLRFVVSWVAGYALRESSEQAEAAEMRATLAEREREAAARIAVAEERARIARELHDIVAHAVSVMVLQAEAIDRHYGHLARDGREHAIRPLDSPERTRIWCPPAAQNPYSAAPTVASSQRSSSPS